ncbi:somatostatin receptor type 5-like [Saccostrea echinata]|uniref:somatostatin receptor type 5-like n=1 Tax=Saccostrea echinata TaxID=191078 RepID=UPI002A8060DA|nr:somatostatin receptor type 5-like [Saccostrea echinata]
MIISNLSGKDDLLTNYQRSFINLTNGSIYLNKNWEIIFGNNDENLSSYYEYSDYKNSNNEQFVIDFVPFVWPIFDYPIFHSVLCYLILIVGGFGLVGNAFTLFKILCTKKLHTPTFTVIGCLALPDFLSIIFFYFVTFTNIYDYLYFYAWESMFLLPSDLYSGLQLMTYLSSIGHLLLLSLIRFLLTVHPLQSRNYLTSSIVISFSAMTWIYSFLMMIPVICLKRSALNIENNFQYMIRMNAVIHLVVETVSGLVPLFIVIRLHCFKIRALRTSTVNTHFRRRMNLVVTIVLFVFMFYHLTVIIRIIILTTSYIYNTPISFYNAVCSFEQFLAIVNYSCNPYIYFFSSLIVSCKKK